MAPKPGENLLVNASMKKRALARLIGSVGSKFVLGYRSATSSIKTRDSAIFSDSGEGESGETLGPP